MHTHTYIQDILRHFSIQNMHYKIKLFTCPNPKQWEHKKAESIRLCWKAAEFIAAIMMHMGNTYDLACSTILLDAIPHDKQLASLLADCNCSTKMHI